MTVPELLMTSQAAADLGISRVHAHSLTTHGYGAREELDRWRAVPKKGPEGQRPKAAAGRPPLACPA
jgi:hypothetical protein